jgi:hypothetical protein
MKDQTQNRIHSTTKHKEDGIKIIYNKKEWMIVVKRL